MLGVEVIQNSPPQIANQIGDITIQGSRQSQKILTGPLFQDIEGDSFTETAQCDPAFGFITYDVNNYILVITAGDNDAGVYNCSVIAQDSHSDTGSTANSFLVTVINNEPPTTTETITQSVSLEAYSTFELIFHPALFTDPNGDKVLYDINPLPVPSWLNSVD